MMVVGCPGNLCHCLTKFYKNYGFQSGLLNPFKGRGSFQRLTSQKPTGYLENRTSARP